MTGNPLSVSAVLRGLVSAARTVLLVAALAAAAAAEPATSRGDDSRAFPLADGGNALARIVVPRQASVTERFAAEELRDYLQKISGARLDIHPEPETETETETETKAVASGQARVLIGATGKGRALIPSLAERDPEAFLVRREGSDLVMTGASDRGTLYAIYNFLEEDLGCRWLGPGEDWEIVPRRGRIEIAGIDRTESPAMKYRFLRMIREGRPGSREADTTDWAVKQKINIASGWPPNEDELFGELAKRGSLRAWMGPHLMIPNILPAEKHIEAHPEWYALCGGARRRVAKGREQLCTTNAEVIARIAEGIGRRFDALPGMDFMGLGQADGTAFCECPDCTALDSGETWSSGSRTAPVITERWLTFVNAVARRLQKTHPGKKVYTLAYHQTFSPPDPDVIRPEPEVMIQAVNSRPNYVCFVHRFEGEDCPRHEKFRQGLEQWVAMTPGGAMVYEYDPHSTFCTMPYPAARKFVADIQYLHRAGVIGFEGQSTTTIWGTYGINHYAIAKTTWDPEIDADWLVRDYCDHAFGEGSAAMQAFIGAIEEGMHAADHITDGVWTYMTPEVMRAARRHLDAAHGAVRDAAAKRRLREWEIGFRYGELGSEAWRTAQQALRDKDAAGLRRAIELVGEAARCCAEEQKKSPHFAAAPGKLISVYRKSWERALKAMAP